MYAMKEVSYSRVLQARAEVSRQAASLSKEGYLKVGTLDFGGAYSVVMRHRANGNRIIITQHDNYCDLKKNGKLIKQIVLWYDVLI